VFESILRRLARQWGYELVPARKPRDPYAQLAQALAAFAVDAVIDVGANRGQYARLLRRVGWPGTILSIEPQPTLQAELEEEARADPGWLVAPAMAIGADEGEAILEVSAETDMSSLLPQTSLLRQISPSSEVVQHLRVPLRRLDRLELIEQSAWRRLFIKLDIQGGEVAALDGAAGLLSRTVGLQVEMGLVPLYQGEADWRTIVDRLGADGFELYLLIPGYFERKLMRQMQVDGVFFNPRALAALPELTPGATLGRGR
jgi:FkbM family methyltransferase